MVVWMMCSGERGRLWRFIDVLGSIGKWKRGSRSENYRFKGR